MPKGAKIVDHTSANNIHSESPQHVCMHDMCVFVLAWWIGEKRNVMAKIYLGSVEIEPLLQKLITKEA